jgi:DnaJ-class molecular chaperone
MKIWCEECKGTCRTKECIGIAECTICNGKGYIEREIVAEDLSYFEQRRIVENHNELAFKNMSKIIFGKWKGLKK